MPGRHRSIFRETTLPLLRIEITEKDPVGLATQGGEMLATAPPLKLTKGGDREVHPSRSRQVSFAALVGSKPAGRAICVRTVSYSP